MNPIELADSCYLKSLRQRCEFKGLDHHIASGLSKHEALKFLERMLELEATEYKREYFGLNSYPGINFSTYTRKDGV